MKLLRASTGRFRQKGQAIVFGLIFIGVIFLALLALYDQSQLVRSRVQIENAADAAAYSQAVHLARQLNFTAYTNRSMVANEVAIGHLVSLLSWSRQYKQLPNWLNTLSKYPPYSVTVIPPLGIQLHTLIRLFTAPLMILGSGLDPVVQAGLKLQNFNAGLNTVLGIAQDMFVAVTLQAQVEALIKVVDEHHFEDEYDKPFVPTIGWFYMMFNYALTYQGDAMGDAIGKFNAKIGDKGAAVLGSFFGGGPIDTSSYEPSTMIQRNKGSADSIANYTHFAAMVNDSLNPWTKERHFETQIGPTVPLAGYNWEFPPIIFRIGLFLEVMNYSDGGTAMVFHTDSDDNPEGSPGWTSVDASTLGAELSFQFYVRFYLPLLFTTIDEVLFNKVIELNDIFKFLNIALPLSTATYQLWGTDQDPFRSARMSAGLPALGPAEAWPSGHYGEAMEGYRNLAMRSPLLTNPAISAQMKFLAEPKCTLPSVWCNKDDLGKKAGDSIRFHSLGNGSPTSYELTAAVAKCMRDVGTSDNPGIVNSDGDLSGLDINKPVGDGNPITNYSVKNASQGETGELASTLRMYWSGNNGCEREDGNEYYDGSGALMTISSAEAYFSPGNAYSGSTLYEGKTVPASLMAPNWDARLREPSELAIMLASGRIGLENLINNFTPANGAKAVIGIFMDTVAGAINQRITDAASGITSIPYVGGALSGFETDIHEKVNEGATGVSDGLSEYIP